MGRYALNSMIFKYAFVLLSLLLLGCQSTITTIGQEHAKEVTKWQELARYAGNELKHFDLTVTVGVKINKSDDQDYFTLVNVQLNRGSNITEIDLLSPEFAQKITCGQECQRLGVYASNFAKQETQLTSFFIAEEGKFFEFYGRLTRLNETLADYRASSPVILNDYLTLMLNRKMTFNSLSEFLDYLEMHITEDTLLSFSESGFISPVEDKLSSTFLNDLLANLPKSWKVNDFQMPSDDFQVNDSKMPSDDFQVNDSKMPSDDFKVNDSKIPSDDFQVNDSKMPSDDFQVNDSKMPSDDFQVNESKMPSDDFQVNDSKIPSDDWDSNGLTPDELLPYILLGNAPTASAIHDNWQQAKQHRIQVGSIACSFSDNIFGVVKGVEGDKAALQVIAQARVIFDDMKLYPPSGYLFTAPEIFYFVNDVHNEIYPLSDIAPCNIEHLKRGQKKTRS